MSSFKEIVFIVQKSRTQSMGYERVAMELARATEPKLKTKLVVVSPPSWVESQSLIPFFSTTISHLNFLFVCIFSSLGKDLVYIFGKNAGPSLPLIRLFSRVKILAQIHYRHKRTDRRNYQYRLWERISERLILKFSDKVFVDNEQAHSYFKEEYGQDTSLISYGADHVKESYHYTNGSQNGKKFALCIMPASESQALMALKPFAQYPKYDYYVMLESKKEYLADEIKKYQEYTHIHFIEAGNPYEKYLSGAYMYIHLEPTVEARLRLLEAMKMGKAVLCFNSIFSRKLTEGEASYFSNHSQLLTALHKAVKKSHFDQGNQMQQLANRLNWNSTSEFIIESAESIGEKLMIPDIVDA